MNVGIGIYRKEDYQEILKLSEDRHNMDLTWKEWNENKKKGAKNFLKLGVKTIDILVTPKELVEYCRKNGLPINGETRAEFVSYKVGLLSEK